MSRLSKYEAIIVEIIVIMVFLTLTALVVFLGLELFGSRQADGKLIGGNNMTSPAFPCPGSTVTMNLDFRNASVTPIPYHASNGKDIKWWNYVGVRQGKGSEVSHWMRYQVDPFTGQNQGLGVPVTKVRPAENASVNINLSGNISELLRDQKSQTFTIQCVNNDNKHVTQNISFKVFQKSFAKPLNEKEDNRIVLVVFSFLYWPFYIIFVLNYFISRWLKMIR